MALLANHSEVQQNCASTIQGRMWFDGCIKLSEVNVQKPTGVEVNIEKKLENNLNVKVFLKYYFVMHSTVT